MDVPCVLKSCQVQLSKILTQTAASGNRACHDVNTTQAWEKRGEVSE